MADHPAAATTQSVPLKTPFYYGWVIVAVGVLVTFMQSGMSNPMLSVFMKPMEAEFGWSRGTISIATTIGSLLGGPLGLALGPVMDKHGSRAILALGSVLLGAAMFGLALTASLWQFYLFFSIGRMIFMGATTVALGVAVSNWFIRKRGRALGVTYMGDRIGGAVLPFLSIFIITSYNWRWAWVVMGVIVWVLAVIPTAVLIRRKPEDVGMLPDGDVSKGPTSASVSSAELETTYTLNEAMRTPTFWMLAGISGIFYMVVGAANLHQLPHMLDVGVPPTLAVGALSLISLCAGLGTVTWGFLVDRLGPRRCLIINYIIATLSMIALVMTKDTVMAYVYAVLYGFSLGGGTPLLLVAWANYYGRGALARIRGTTTLFNQILNAIGPAVAGILYDMNHSYTIPFLLFALAYAVSVVFAILSTPPGPPKRLAKPETPA
ncbi:MAG: MFS transporter [Dehalococcoidia bacterium]|nr:MFS transporter [Dehalococcoidia bacterium]